MIVYRSGVEYVKMRAYVTFKFVEALIKSEKNSL